MKSKRKYIRRKTSAPYASFKRKSYTLKFSLNIFFWLNIKIQSNNSQIKVQLNFYHYHCIITITQNIIDVRFLWSKYCHFLLRQRKWWKCLQGRHCRSVFLVRWCLVVTICVELWWKSWLNTMEYFNFVIANVKQKLEIVFIGRKWDIEEKR